MPKQYQLKKHKNCIVLMQLHLMLHVFVSYAWLAPWIFFENCCYEFFETILQDVYNMPNTFYLLIQPLKHDFYSCLRNLLQTGNVDHEVSLLVIKLTTIRRKIIQRSIFKVICFLALVSFIYSQFTPLRCNDAIASWMRHEQKWKKFVEKFIWRYQWV